MTSNQQTTRNIPEEPLPFQRKSSLGRKVILAFGYGFAASILWGLSFGLLSWVSIIIGVVAGFGLGFVTAAAVLAPFKLVTRKLAWAFFPLSVIYTSLGLLPLVLIPFILVTLQHDPSTNLSMAVQLAWAFYKAIVFQFSSSFLITAITAAGAVVGYLGRLHRLRRIGIYQP